MITNPVQTQDVIFAADDDKDDLALLSLLLRKAGVELPLRLFRDGQELVAAFAQMLENSVQAIRPVLCFLDVKLADVPGHDVLRWIRAQPRLDKVPVVILSGSEHPRDVTTAMESGAQCYLTKYPQPAVLREVFDEAQRFALGAPADECFRFPTNQLLIRGRRLWNRA